MRSFILYITMFCLSASLLQGAQQPLRVAVIGGMVMSGMWQKVAESFEKTSTIPLELVVTGDKHELDRYCRSHEVDLVTMHSSDTIVDLTGDGLFEQLTPWVRNAQMIVGSISNPAKLDANDSLEHALQKITMTHAPFLVHTSGGTFEVFSDLNAAYGFGSEHGSVTFTTGKQGFLQQIADEGGYTLYGVIPFLMKKRHQNDLQGFMFEDKKLRRPYLAAIAPAARIGTTRHNDAQKLLDFLTTEKTQNLIKNFRIERFENTPAFFPLKP